MSRPKKKKKPFDDDLSEDYDFPLISSSTRTINKSNKIRYDDVDDQTARKKPSKKLSRESILEEDMRQCFDLLQNLMAQPQAPPFLEPLDYHGLGLYLYPQIIKIPMDFGSIKSMLLHNTLANPDHFADHVRLVCRNAMEFNQEGSPVHIQAAELLDWFEPRYAELMARLYPASQGHHDPMDLEKNDGELTLEELSELAQKNALLEEENARIAALRQSIESLRREARKPQLKFVRLTQPHPPLSYREKEAIAKKIADLPSDNVPGLLQIIHAAQPPSAGEDDEVEVDIERLDDGTLLKIEAYVDRSMAARSHKRAQPSSKPKSRPPSSGSKSSSGQKRQRPAVNTAAPTKKAAPVDPGLGDHRQKLATAQAETKKRIADLQKQIHGVDRAKALVPGMTIAINPEDPAEGFWVGYVTAPPSGGQVMVQWYEMKDRATTDLSADTRSYTKSPNYDLIPVETIMFGIDIKLLYDQDRQQWVLNGVREIMAQIRSLE